MRASPTLNKTTKSSAEPQEDRSTRRDAGDDEGRAAGCRVDLDAAEVELLLKACQKYRSSLPGYLLSVKDEIAVADAIIQKLRKMGQQ